MYKMMTPGPSQVRENVLLARSRQFQNPDLDCDFVEYYHDTCKLYSSLLHTENESLILGGEGILGLEAACASLTEPGDRVLVLDNGVFGEGFKDFVSIYGGTPVLYTCDYSHPFDVNDLKAYLEKDHDFKYATVVHCDTPSGMLNDIASICPLLKSYGILTVVDSVAGMFGEVSLFVYKTMIFRHSLAHFFELLNQFQIGSGYFQVGFQCFTVRGSNLHCDHRTFCQYAFSRSGGNKFWKFWVVCGKCTPETGEFHHI